MKNSVFNNKEQFFVNLEKERIITSLKIKIPNSNKIPFLQAQILQKIYLNLFEEKKTTKAFTHQPTPSLDKFVKVLESKIKLRLGLILE